MDSDQRPRGGFVAIVDLHPDVRPTKALLVGIGTCDPAEHLKGGIVEHGHIMPDVEMAHFVAHTGMCDAGIGDDSSPGHNATSSPPFSFRRPRASSAVAISSDSSPRIRLILTTCSALLFASAPLPIR